MTDTIDNVGRPPANPQELENVLQKLRPDIENGLSVNKACLVNGIAPSNVFYWMDTYPWFLERIEAYKSYKSKIVADAFRYKTELIKYKIQILDELRKKLTNPELNTSDRILLIDQIDKLELAGGEVGFLQWLALNDKSLRDEYGMRTEVTGKDGVPLGQTLDSLEAPKKTNYAQLGQEARRQMVAPNAPIQNQDQIGGASDVQPEHNAVEASSGESGTQPGVTTQS